MTTWVLIIYTQMMMSTTMTAVPGFVTHPQCMEAGRNVMSLAVGSVHKSIDYVCVEQGWANKPAEKTR